MLNLVKPVQSFVMTAANSSHVTSCFRSQDDGVPSPIDFKFDIDIKDSVSNFGSDHHNWRQYEGLLSISISSVPGMVTTWDPEENVMTDLIMFKRPQPGSIVIPVVLSLVTVRGVTTLYFEPTEYNKFVKVNSLACSVSDDEAVKIGLWSNYEFLQTYILTLQFPYENPAADQAAQLLERASLSEGEEPAPEVA